MTAAVVIAIVITAIVAVIVTVVIAAIVAIIAAVAAAAYLGAGPGIIRMIAAVIGAGYTVQCSITVISAGAAGTTSSRCHDDSPLFSAHARSLGSVSSYAGERKGVPGGGIAVNRAGRRHIPEKSPGSFILPANEKLLTNFPSFVRSFCCFMQFLISRGLPKRRAFPGWSRPHFRWRAGRPLPGIRSRRRWSSGRRGRPERYHRR